MTTLAHWWASFLRLWHDPNWVGAFGQWAGAVATVAAVIVALWLPRWERRRDAAERLRQRQEQQLDNARLVTVSVPRDRPYRYIEIFNNSDLPAHQPRVDSISDNCVQFDPNARPRIWDPKQGRGSFHPDVLPPNTPHYVLYEYRASDDGEDEDEKRITADDVTITFIDAYGQLWRRTGHGEPVWVTEPNDAHSGPDPA